MNRDMKALVRAHGLALSMLTAFLERDDLIPRGELGRSLALLATATAETDRRSGDIVAAWAAMLQDASDAITPSPNDDGLSASG